jgi:hypothetical protein
MKSYVTPDRQVTFWNCTDRLRIQPADTKFFEDKETELKLVVTLLLVSIETLTVAMKTSICPLFERSNTTKPLELSVVLFMRKPVVGSL